LDAIQELRDLDYYSELLAALIAENAQVSNSRLA
jgi:hypothetical protein